MQLLNLGQPNAKGISDAIVRIGGGNVQNITSGLQTLHNTIPIALSPGSVFQVAVGGQEWAVKLAQTFAGLSAKLATFEWLYKPDVVVRSLVRAMDAARNEALIGFIAATAGFVAFLAITAYDRKHSSPKNVEPESNAEAHGLSNALRHATTQIKHALSEQASNFHKGLASNLRSS